MSNLTNLQIPTLKVSGSNYLPWALDVKMYLRTIGPEDTMKQENLHPNKIRQKQWFFSITIYVEA